MASVRVTTAAPLWRRSHTLAFMALAGAIALFCLFPFYWALATSLKPLGEAFQMPPTLYPHRLTVATYSFVLFHSPFPRNIWNSLVVATATTVLCLLISSGCAYALARLHFHGRAVVLGFILATLAFPTITLIDPLFVELTNVGWLNTYQGLVIPYVTFALPLATWLLTVFFGELPREVEEAALVDGCTHVSVLYRIMIPLSGPVLVTAGLLTFLSACQELPLALIVSVDDSVRTVPPAMLYLFGLTSWRETLTAAVLVTVPLTAVVLLFQRRIVAGITAGALGG